MASKEIDKLHNVFCSSSLFSLDWHQKLALQPNWFHCEMLSPPTTCLLAIFFFSDARIYFLIKNYLARQTITVIKFITFYVSRMEKPKRVICHALGIYLAILHGGIIVIVVDYRRRIALRSVKACFYISVASKSRKMLSLKNGFSGLIKVLRYSVEFAVARINDVSDTHIHACTLHTHTAITDYSHCSTMLNMCLNGLTRVAANQPNF